jgi:hypothetical protein
MDQASNMMRSVKNLNNPPKYELLNHDKIKDFACVKILEGEFSGCVYHYNTVKVDEMSESAEEVPLRFTYNVVEGYNEDWSIGEFEDTICSILMNLVEKQTSNVD